ncbi:MAG: hypothetical protein AB7I41_22780 [Candidatus Sericytochromatia bacterium]
MNRNTSPEYFMTPEGLRFQIRNRSLYWLDSVPATDDHPTSVEMTEMLFGWYLSQRELPLPTGEEGDQALGEAFAELLGGQALKSKVPA